MAGPKHQDPKEKPYFYIMRIRDIYGSVQEDEALYILYKKRRKTDKTVQIAKYRK